MTTTAKTAKVTKTTKPQFEAKPQQEQETKQTPRSLATKELIFLLLIVANEAREQHKEEREVIAMLNIDMKIVKTFAMKCPGLTTPDAAGETYIKEENGVVTATAKGFRHAMNARTFGTNFLKFFRSLNPKAMLPAFIGFVQAMDEKLTDQEGNKRTITRYNRENQESGYWKAWDDNLATLNQMVESA